MSEIKAIVKDINSMPWEELISERTGKKMIEKKLIDDPDTGMLISYSH
jgi:hypothetical protein